MHKCPKCGTEFDGNFCPECGEKFAEEKTCPKCGAALSGSAKFCPECGFSFYEKPVPAPAPAPKPAPATRKPEAGKPVTAGAKKMYAAVSALPAVLLGLVSVLLFFFFLAPVAVMPGGELLGEKIPSTSFGNVYESSDYVDMSFTGSMTALIVFAAFALFVVFLIVVSRVFSKLLYKRVTLAGKQIFLRNILTAVGYVLFFVLFLISCILLGQIANEDGGLGLMTTGAAPVLVLVFTLISTLAALVCAFAGAHFRKTYPALVAETEEKIAAAKPTKAEIWMKQHKALMIVLTVLLIIALVVGIAVPVGLANRHNGTYFAYNGETGEYHKEQYYKLSGGSWEDENGTKGKISFDGENVTLTYDPTGGMDTTGSSSITIEGTIDGDVLKVGGTVYAKAGHKHKFGEWETEVEPTCITVGTKAETCACGHKNQEELPALRHRFINHVCEHCGVNSSFTLDFTLNEEETEYSVTGIGSCTDYEIIIPAEFNNKPVTSIGSAAFKNRWIRSIDIPDSVTKIESYAFSDCSGLTEITIPNNVVSIGGSAFKGCKSLTSVVWNAENCTEAGNTSYPIFSDCENMKTVTIGEKVETILIDVFHHCRLEHIEVAAGNSLYRSEQNCVIEKQSNTLIFGFKSSVIPNSVNKIGDSAFDDCSGLTNITIPDSVTTIGNSAFHRCNGLTEITIPNSVTTIGGGAFMSCESLTSVIWNAENCTEAGNGYYPMIFSESVNLKTAAIGEEVKTIPAMLFSGCSGLKNIKIGHSVVSIGNSAFSGCSGLTSIEIPDSVTSIGNSAFYQCSGLTSITIPDSVTSIGEDAFLWCSGLTEINISDGVTSIGDDAFSATAYYEDATKWDTRGVLYIGNYLISAETTISGTYIIRKGTKTIADCAFFDCTRLTKITIPDSVTSIGDGAFSRCTKLTEITIPDNVTSIGDSAFSGCARLTKITIPDKVTSIGQRAFYRCGDKMDFQFKGTVTEWQAIEKGIDWDKDTDDYTVTCTDGRIASDGTVTMN